MKTCRQNSYTSVGTPAPQCGRRQRENGTREVLPRTTTTLVVLKASAYHTHRGEVPETETEQLSNKRLHPKDGRITARLFSMLFNSVFSPQRQPNQMLTDTQRGWFCFLCKG